MSDGELLSSELYWIHREPWFKSRGYSLRPRFTPGWIPSWKRDPKKIRILQEDSVLTHHPHVGLDAIRISDGKRVYLKRILKNSSEEVIIKYLMAPSISQEARRYTVSFLEIWEDVPQDDQYSIIVMPLLQQFRIPRFDTVGECVDCVEQLLEALQFLHRHNIAHRDCQRGNIRMEADLLFPRGFHPVQNEMNVEYSGHAVHYTRTQYPPRYLFIDFGISVLYPLSEKSPLALPVRGGDRTVPEFQDETAPDTPYNPFPTDIYYLGNTIKRTFLKDGEDLIQGHLGMEFLRPLVDAMTRTNPSERPTVDGAIEQLKGIVASLSRWKLRSSVSMPKDTIYGDIARFFPYWSRRISYSVRRVHPIPSRNVKVIRHKPKAIVDTRPLHSDKE
ncbi:hypothetical protein BJ165DRAFT_1470525 [Panaeolus papilionaceus]|nr:hypothetical protein BJ165DRAFT_1470525 [Panaeolus papilionaceus]